jgi:predicted ABC-type ATPase
MKVHIPNSAFLGNFEAFIKHFNNQDPTSLEIKSNQSWISIHPLVISMVIALAREIKLSGGSIINQDFSAKSRPYLLRMGLIEELTINHGFQSMRKLADLSKQEL